MSFDAIIRMIFVTFFCLSWSNFITMINVKMGRRRGKTIFLNFTNGSDINFISYLDCLRAKHTRYHGIYLLIIYLPRLIFRTPENYYHSARSFFRVIGMKLSLAIKMRIESYFNS